MYTCVFVHTSYLYLDPMFIGTQKAGAGEQVYKWSQQRARGSVPTFVTFYLLFNYMSMRLPFIPLRECLRGRRFRASLLLRLHLLVPAVLGALLG